MEFQRVLLAFGKPTLFRFRGASAGESVHTQFIAILKLPFKLDRHVHTCKPDQRHGE